MVNPHNVDICVTCVSDKPPTLPLREELPSLGIEVVYNAQGTGAKASKHASRKLVKKFREREKEKDAKGSKFLPLGLGKQTEKQQYRDRKESELKVPRALSYESYERRLLHSGDGKGKDDSSSVASWDTTSTSKSSDKSPSKNKPKSTKAKGWQNFKNRLQARRREKKGRVDPPKTVEIPSPSPEEQAIKDAKNAFDEIVSSPSKETDKTSSRSSGGNRTSGGSHGVTSSSGQDPSTLDTNTNGDSTNNKESTTTTTPPSQQTPIFPDLLAHGEQQTNGSTTTGQEDNTDTTGSPPTDGKQGEVKGSSSGQSNTTETESDDRKQPAVYSPPPSPSMSKSNSTHNNSTITSQHSRGEAVKEFYDLTALDDDAKNIIFDSSSHSRASREPSSTSGSSSSKRIDERMEMVNLFPQTTLDPMEIPEIEDDYGNVVLDLSFVDEESVSTRGSIRGSSRSRIAFGLETVVEDDIMQSPTEKTGHVGNHQLFNIDEQQLQPQEEVFDGVYEGVSYNDDEEEELPPEPVSPSSNLQRIEYLLDANADSSDDDKESTEESDDAPTNSGSSDDSDDSMVISPDDSLAEENGGYPSVQLPQSVSYSSTRPKVSFSQDVEEHYYVKEEETNESQFGDGRMPFQIVTISEGPDSFDKFYRQTTPTSQEHGVETQPSVTSYEDCFKNVSVAPHSATSHRGYPIESELLIETREEEEDRSEDMFSGSPVRSTSSYGSESDVSGSGRKQPYFSDDETADSERPSEVSSLDPAAMRDGFIAALSSGVPLTKELATIMRSSPELAAFQLPEKERLPLHVVCDRPFPIRSTTEKEKSLATVLAKDVAERKRLIELVASANLEACTVPDENGDLPVHLLARQLMEWEAHWYQMVYEKAQTGSQDEEDNAAAITKLYQNMSQAIDLVLHPIAANHIVCQIPGSVGYLLPLHIAAIFTVSYTTLQALLEQYPYAASSQCNLIDVHTFIPSNSIPLELHDRLSTDFPKWELKDDKNVESAHLSDEAPASKDSIRRSDLMFAYHPYVAPYQDDETRIQRIESLIMHEAISLVKDNELQLNPATRRLWIWMCTFDGTDQKDGSEKNKTEEYRTHAESVRRIVQSLPMRNVRMLALVLDGYGRAAIDIATPDCAASIWKRFDEIAETEIPIPVADMSMRGKGTHSAILNEWEETLASRICLQGRGYVSTLCRSLFHIREDGFPTSFIFLPYKLVKDEQGRLGLESPKAAELAVKFSDVLLELTCPKKIRHFLEKKSIRFLGESLGVEEDEDWFEVEDAIKEQMERMLSLYASGPAYFYFLDEISGIPVVSNTSDIYPLKIADPVDLVRKIFPLMLTGMILMRGEKALSLIATILLDKNTTVIKRNWIDTAKDLVGYLISPRTEWTNAYLHDLLPLREDIVDFIERGTSIETATRDSLGLSSEWVVELSSVRMLVEMHDPEHKYSGLKARYGGNKVLWTRNKRFLDASSRRNLFTYDFKSFADLREMFSEQEIEDIVPVPSQESEKSHESEKEKPDTEEIDDIEIPAGYGYLFGDLAIPVHQNSMEKDDSENKKEPTSPRGLETAPTSPTPPARKSRYATASHPISLLTFDKDCELDEVLQLRIQLDEQEAKLDFLKDKLVDIKTAEDSLTKEEDDLGKILDDVTDRKKVLEDEGPQAVVDARKLLLRLCDLEDRVLCKEIEVQQLNMEVSCLELESEAQTDEPLVVEQESDDERRGDIPDEVTFGSNHRDEEAED